MLGKNAATLLAFPLLLVGVAHAQDNTKLPPIKTLADAKPNASVFRAASRNKPLVLHSKKNAAKYFVAGDLAKLMKQTDFKQQFVLVFAWRGSSQDRLDYAVLESFPEQVVFSFKPGRTKDLRPHVYVYVLRSNVKWRTRAKAESAPIKELGESI